MVRHYTGEGQNENKWSPFSRWHNAKILVPEGNCCKIAISLTLWVLSAKASFRERTERICLPDSASPHVDPSSNWTQSTAPTALTTVAPGSFELVEVSIGKANRSA